jgi:hypothetical protein
MEGHTIDNDYALQMWTFMQRRRTYENERVRRNHLFGELFCVKRVAEPSSVEEKSCD